MVPQRSTCILILLLGLARPGGAADQPDCCTLRPEPLQHHFALVIDRSGSMSGDPMQEAINGAQAFVDQLQAGDRAAVIAFDNQVEQLQGMTSDHGALKSAIRGIRSGGSTALYDAVVRGAGTVLAESGAHIVVFLTDGSDTSSRYTLQDIAAMGLSEGIFIYGIGLGDVDAQALADLTRATGGIVELTSDPQALRPLYQKVLLNYYQKFGALMAESGAYAIRSLPSGSEVRFDGKSVGRTPLKIDNVTPGDHQVEVVFGRGTWSCTAPAASGYRTLIDAREAELGYDLWVASRPHGATVFLDGTYLGVTGLSIVRTEQKEWGEKVKKDPRALRIPLVPKGKHELRLVAMPDMDFGPEQEIALELDMDGQERVLQIDIMSRRVVMDDGTVLKQAPRDRFKELDSELDVEDPFDF